MAAVRLHFMQASACVPISDRKCGAAEWTEIIIVRRNLKCQYCFAVPTSAPCTTKLFTCPVE